jgi:hypothetical protein
LAERVANRCRELRSHVVVPDEKTRAYFNRSVMGLLEIIGERQKALVDEMKKMLGLKDGKEE